MNDRQRLEAIVDVVRSYLPPDGIKREEAMSQIIALVDPLPAQPEQEPVAYLYHDTACAELANPLAGSTLLVLACDRKPNGRNETPLYTAPPSKQEPVEYDAPALYKAKAEREQAEKQESYLVAVIGNWGRVEWVDGVYPQIGDRMYSAPPSKPWVSLTDEEKQDIKGRWVCGEFESFDDCLAVFEAALRSKNT